LWSVFREVREATFVLGHASSNDPPVNALYHHRDVGLELQALFKALPRMVAGRAATYAPLQQRGEPHAQG
jgi:hypothetical protein